MKTLQHKIWQLRSTSADESDQMNFMSYISFYGVVNYSTFARHASSVVAACVI